MAKPTVRRQTKYVALTKAQFRERFFARFYDPAFDEVKPELERVFEKAWDGYIVYRKSPRKKPAGKGFADPRFALPIEWLDTRAKILAAAKRQKDPKSPSRILIVNGSTRSEHSCPGEISKTRRLAQQAQITIESLRDFAVDFLDLSTLADEPDKTIFPCKACVSTAQPLCHWPCSCYPNHAMGQVNDWMNEIYPRWAAAHGVMILCPVHWYQAPASLKLMIDRLVCADGGNPDPTTTHGKKAEEAKKLELAGWDYPKHLAGRAYGLVVHGDVAGIEGTRRSLSDWLDWMGLIDSGNMARLDRYIGYFESYAESHEALDRDRAVQDEVRNVARSVAHAVGELRAGRLSEPDRDLRAPRPK
ncbi:MAG: flavodoxin family protein [Telluria sp.]